MELIEIVLGQNLGLRQSYYC